MTVTDEPQGPLPHPPAYFFLAYAHTPEHPWVSRFYRNLCSEITERTEWPTHLQPGFMDVVGIRVGEDWRRAVSGALATCRVLVPLYSRRYFTRVECGREWHAFHGRMQVHEELNGFGVTPIVPALWTPVPDDSIPRSVRDVHVDFRSINQTYADEGLYTLIKNSAYKRTYLRVVQHIAEQVIVAAEQQPLRTCGPQDIDLTRNAFQAATAAPANRRLKIMVAAPTADHRPADRSATCYGRTAPLWTPYHPGHPTPLAETAAQIARSYDYEPEILTADQGLTQQDWSSPDGGLGVVLVDPWLALDPERADQLRRIDELGVGRVGTILIWNSSDQQTVGRADELQKALHAVAPRVLGELNTPNGLGVSKVHSAAEFETTLPAVLDRALNRYLKHAQAQTPPGTTGARPQLFGPEAGPLGWERPRQEPDDGD